MGQTLAFQIVRPDKLLCAGDAKSVVLVTPTGEVGVLAGHAREVCLLGEGVVRVEHAPNKEGKTQTRVVVRGGYAEITPDAVLVLADHARDANDIYPDVVEETRDAAQKELDGLDSHDSRRAYFEAKVAWCNTLLREAKRQVGA